MAEESASSNKFSKDNLRPYRNESSEVGARLHLVVGGSGFIGRHIVEYLLAQGERVRVFDIRQTFNDDRLEGFYLGDICSLSDVSLAICDVDTVFHCAAIVDNSKSKRTVFEVNVNGTRNVLNASLANRVIQLIYTSSSAVVLSGSGISDGDESLPYPEKHLDAYGKSKAEAEQLVLNANGRQNAAGSFVYTCALRPHLCFGPRDSHLLAQMLNKARIGAITHVVGDGTSITDFTYVENVVYAHILAADRLVENSPACGQAYFVTNADPSSFWTFVSTFLNEMGCVSPRKRISFRLAYAFAYIMELLKKLLSWIVCVDPVMSRRLIVMMARQNWFSVRKAARHLGYRPLVSLREGLDRTVDYLSQADSPPLSPQESYHKSMKELSRIDDSTRVA